MDTAELFRWVLENLNYWVVTLFMAIESSFIPFPSEVVVPPAAWKAMTDDAMNIFLVVVFATAGADIGALVNYYLARWLGRPIVYKFADSRFGHLCLIDRVLRTVDTRCAPADKHSCRTCRDECSSLPCLYYVGSRRVELGARSPWLPYIPFYRIENDGRRLYTCHKVQP